MFQERKGLGVLEKPYRDEFLEQAVGDFLEIQRFLDLLEPKRGSAFYQQMENTIAMLRDFPESGRVVHDSGVRQFALKRFPYYLIYAFKNNIVLIMAVGHQHQNPDFWFSRLKYLDEGLS